MIDQTYSGRPYNELVKEGQRIVATQSKSNWQLGDLAIENVGPAGTQEVHEPGSLKEFAEDIGVEYDRLKSYRLVSSAWERDARHVDKKVPWVCFRTIYKERDKADIMNSFIAKCEASGNKPSYRLFQEHIGKEATREYTKRNAKETAGQALGDLETADKVEVITPIVAEPEVAKGIIENDDARKAIQTAEHGHYMDLVPQGMREGSLGLPIGIDSELDHIDRHLKTIYDIATNRRIDWSTYREVIPQRLKQIARQAEGLAEIVEDPNSARLSDDELERLASGR